MTNMLVFSPGFTPAATSSIAGDRWGVSNSLNNPANVALDQGHYSAARDLHEESLILRRHLGDRSGVANSTQQSRQHRGSRWQLSDGCGVCA
jgi:hypothetical protein